MPTPARSSKAKISHDRYVITNRLSMANMLNADQLTWEEFFDSRRGVDTWLGLRPKTTPWRGEGLRNRQIDSPIVLPIIELKGRPASMSILETFTGEPDLVPGDLVENDWEAYWKGGPSELDGEVWLGCGWKWPEINEILVQCRTREKDVVSQVKKELYNLKEAYRAIHKQFPPLDYWRSRQMRLAFLDACRLHCDPRLGRPLKEWSQLEIRRDYNYNGIAWMAFLWGVRNIKVFCDTPLGPTSFDWGPKQVAELRAYKKNGLSVEGLAGRVGISRRQVSRHLAGAVPNPKNQEAYKELLEEQEAVLPGKRPG